MKHIALSILLLAAADSAALAAEPHSRGHYCNLGVFTSAELARQKEIVEKLAPAVTARHDLEGGYAFQFPGESKEIGEFVDGVRRCCPTLNYRVSYASQLGPVSIDVTGENEARAFIREEFRRLFEKKL